MKSKILLSAVILLAATVQAMASALPESPPAITGDYLEVRSCDVYTGPCFANGEMGLTGKEAIMVWAIREGAWEGVELDGLNVIAVIKTDATLGDLRYQPRHGQALLIVDANADPEQKKALMGLARSMGADLIKEVVKVESHKIEASIDARSKAGSASVKAEGLVEISTRALGVQDLMCGNEEIYYPPLSKIRDAYPAFTKLAVFSGDTLNRTWEAVGERSAFIGTFSR